MLSPVEFERQQILKAQGVQKARGYSILFIENYDPRNDHLPRLRSKKRSITS